MPTPESAKENRVAAESVENTPDFAELQREKEALFKEIEESSFELNTDEKSKIVEWVSGFSVKDGFELARRLGLDGKVYAMTGLAFATVKNKGFVKKFSDLRRPTKTFSVKMTMTFMWSR